MRRREVILKTAIIVMVILGLAGCSGKRDAVSPETETPAEFTQEIPEEQNAETDVSAPEELSEVLVREEIRIDFPFHDSEEYTLTLAKLLDSSNEYELMLYRKEGEVLQRIPCGKLTEPIDFSYDRLDYKDENDLEIFSAGSTTGLLFLWEEERFAKEPIEIPKYDELRGMSMLTVTEEGDKLEKRIYLINKEKMRADEIRSYSLNRESGQLLIRDSLEQLNLFDGIVHLNEENNPENAEYYDMLLWNDIYAPGNFEGQSLLPVWIGEDFETEVQTDSGFEKIQNEVFGNPGYTKDYESRQALLEEFGFADSEPMYQFFDQYGKLQLELYMDDAMENICGIYHEYAFNSELEKVDFNQYGFTLRVLYEGEWEERDKYSLKTVDGYDGTESEDWIKDYEANAVYREDGRPDCFESSGRIDDSPERSTLISINFVYREDGTLYYRDYDHNGLAFETSLSYLDSYYDEKERVVYEKGYITHGHVEYYYIYEDESDKPAYCLYLDHNLGYVIPQMIRYH
ncbi:MAG: hypothetical protein HDR20_08860 [Lachnospiraceae bacterium]|nr:hypothetical protein [Lachnospiraceae bacterium]